MLGTIHYTRPLTLAENSYDAAAYGAWFRAKVIEALDDPRPAIPNDDVKARFAARRAAAEGHVESCDHAAQSH